MPDGLDPKVVEVYTAVGKLLSRYSAGKVPKAFKIVPTLKSWEEVRLARPGVVLLAPCSVCLRGCSRGRQGARSTAALRDPCRCCT